MPVGFPSISSQQDLSLLLPKWRAALGAVRSPVGSVGKRNANLLIVEDSIGFGVGSNGTLATGDLKKAAYPTQLTAMFNANGTPAICQSIFGDGIPGVTNVANDSRITTSGTLLDQNQFVDGTVGGIIPYIVPNFSGTWSFQPVVPVDTFDFYYATGPGTGPFTIDINGAGTINVNPPTVVNGVAKQTIVGTLGINKVNISKTNNSALVYLLGIVAYNSAVSAVNVMNAGWPGGCATDNTSGGSWSHSFGAPWNAINMIPFYAPDVTVIALGNNDWSNGYSLSGYKAGLQSLITAAKITGDVLLVAPPVSNPAGGSNIPYATQQQYISKILELSASNNLALLNLWNRTFPWVTYKSLGYWFDANHPKALGYSDIAQAVYNMLGNI